MFNVPPPTPPLTGTHWVYDDPSGVAEPGPYLRSWRRPRRPVLNVTLVRRPARLRVAQRGA
jgi:hypothetical protein